MNKTIKKILIWTPSIIVMGIIGYIGFVAYLVFSYSSGCGMNDGPFKAVLINPALFSDSTQPFKLSDNGKLILINRIDTLFPLLTPI